MNEAEMLKVLEQLLGTVNEIKRQVAVLAGQRHAVHRKCIMDGTTDPALPAMLDREERVPGIPFDRLLRPYGNGNGHN